MKPYYQDSAVTIYHGDALAMLAALPSESVHCCLTSPPYWGLRDYGAEGQIGLEGTPEEYVEKLVEVFRAVRRVLRPAGTLWLNLGDTYNGFMANQRATSISAATQHARPRFESGHGPRTRNLKPKDLVGIPWRVAFALQADGWWLRQDIIWAKPNPMPESVTDRPTKAHEYLFLLAKSERYFYDAQAIAEKAVMAPGKSGFGGPKNNDGVKAHTNDVGKAWDKTESRNARSVWTIATQPFSEAHFATFPPALARRAILAGCPSGGAVLDPFYGAGTTGMVAKNLNRRCIGIELNPEYCEIAARRCAQEVLDLSR
jgi:DNA modification methylase